MFSIGITSPSGKHKSPTELELHVRSELCMLFMMLIASINALLHVLALTIEENRAIADVSDALIKDLQDEPWVKEPRS
jgi:hypothetical protein